MKVTISVTKASIEYGKLRLELLAKKLTASLPENFGILKSNLVFGM